MKREVSISALLGVFSGFFFVLTATALDVVGVKFDAWLPAVSSLAIFFAVIIYLLRDADRKRFGVAIVVFAILSAYSVSSSYDFSSIGPNPEQLAYFHLLSKIREGDGKIDSNWEDSSWNFLSPKCYSVSVARKYDNTSLEVAVFSYRYSKTQYDPNRFIKVLFTKLFCGCADSETAYGEYKRTLSNAGFELKEYDSSFLAENMSLIVLCSRESELITVVRVEKDELNTLEALIFGDGKIVRILKNGENK